MEVKDRRGNRVRINQCITWHIGLGTNNDGRCWVCMAYTSVWALPRQVPMTVLSTCRVILLECCLHQPKHPLVWVRCLQSFRWESTTVCWIDFADRINLYAFGNHNRADSWVYLSSLPGSSGCWMPNRSTLSKKCKTKRKHFHTNQQQEEEKLLWSRQPDCSWDCVIIHRCCYFILFHLLINKPLVFPAVQWCNVFWRGKQHLF